MDSKPHILLIVENDFSRKHLHDKIAARGLAVQSAVSVSDALQDLDADINLVWLDLSARAYELSDAVAELRLVGPLSTIGIAPATHAEMLRRARNAGVAHILAHDKLDDLLEHLCAAADVNGSESGESESGANA